MLECVWQNGQPLTYRNWVDDLFTRDNSVSLQFYSDDQIYWENLSRSFTISLFLYMYKNNPNLTFLEQHYAKQMFIDNRDNSDYGRLTGQTVMCGMISTEMHTYGKWMLVNCSKEMSYSVICEKRNETQKTRHLKLLRSDFECSHSEVYVHWFCFAFVKNLTETCMNITSTPLLNKYLIIWSLSRTHIIGYKLYNESYGMCTQRVCSKCTGHGRHDWHDINCNPKIVKFWICRSAVHYVQSACIGNPTQFRCSDGTCIIADHVCDNIQDCPDNSDEKDCSNVCTAGNSCFTDCPKKDCHCNFNYIQLFSRCLPMYIWYQRWTYEHYISGRSQALETGEFATCPDGWSKCSPTETSLCYPNSNICVFERTIFGDSKYCRNSEHLRYCIDHQCPSMFSCNLTYCIPFHMVCDGVVDCPDARDEEHYHCATLSCPGMLKCRHDSKCIHPNFYCDGVIHCLISQDDERFCGSCHSDCVCSGHTMTCYELRNRFYALNYTVTTLFIEKTFVKFDLRNFNTNITVLNISSVTVLSADIQNSINIQTELRYLIMINNSLSMLESYVFSNLNCLLYLVIEKNMISFIDSYAFSGLNSIEYLNLSNLDIHVVGKCAFCDMATLKEIDISNNSITQIQAGVLQFSNPVHALNISSNDIEYYDSNGFINNLHILISNQNTMCCYARHLISSCESIDINSFCKLILMSDSSSYACLLFTVFLLVINIYVIIGHMSTKVNHFTLIQSLSFVHLFYVSYLLALTTTHFWYKDTFPLHKQSWLQSVPCHLESFVFVLFLLQSKCTSMLLEANYVLVTKYSMTKHPLSKKAIIYLLGLMWSINVTLAAIFSKYTESSDIYCTPYSITTQYKSIIYITFTVFLTVRGIFMAVCYALILITVHRSAQRVKHATSSSRQHRYHLLVARSLVTVGAFVLASCSVTVALFWRQLNKYQWLELFILVVCIPFDTLVDPLQYTIVPKLRSSTRFKCI